MPPPTSTVASPADTAAATPTTTTKQQHQVFFPPAAKYVPQGRVYDHIRQLVPPQINYKNQSWRVVNIAAGGSHQSHSTHQSKFEAAFAGKVYDSMFPSYKGDAHMLHPFRKLDEFSYDSKYATSLKSTQAGSNRGGEATAPGNGLQTYRRAGNTQSARWKPQSLRYPPPAPVKLAPLPTEAQNSLICGSNSNKFRRRREFGSVVDAHPPGFRVGKAEWLSSTSDVSFADPFIHKRNFAVY